MSRILVTGGNGFIGSRVAEDLSKEHKVFVLDLTESKKFDSFACDIADRKWIDSIGKFDFIFHFASLGGGFYRTSNPIKLLHTELTGLYNVLNYALKYNSKKVVYSSTTLLTEEFRKSFSFSKIKSNPYFSYAAAKLLSEYYLEEFHRENNTGYSIVRYYNVYGENQSDSMAIPLFIRQALEGRPLVIFGSGKQQRDFTYVGDVSKATILAAFSEKTFSKTINIGTGKKTSILELAKLIKKLTKSKSEVIHDEFPEGLKEFETDRMQFNSAELKELIGFECKTPLEEGLKKMIKFIEGK
ncbi:MAG: NAD-dependent epimerase/dehydratase family protein [archaeon]